jgi:hypothetical protein
MSGSSSLALSALIAMVVFYAVENLAPIALLGFSVSSVLVALCELTPGRWPFGLVALGFAAVALQRWSMRRHGEKRPS